MIDGVHFDKTGMDVNKKIKTKMSGCFRTQECAQDRLEVMSYLSICVKHGVGMFNVLAAAFAVNNRSYCSSFLRNFSADCGWQNYFALLSYEVISAKSLI